MAIDSSGNWQFMPCDHEYTVVCQQNKSTVAVTHSYLLKNDERLECIPWDSHYSLKQVLIDYVDVAYIRQTFYNVNNLYDLFTIKT